MSESRRDRFIRLLKSKSDLDIIEFTHDAVRELIEVLEEPERTGRCIETEGLDEEIRCLMCTNHMRSNRGCDGACQYNERMYKDIMSALERRMMEVEHDNNRVN